MWANTSMPFRASSAFRRSTVSVAPCALGSVTRSATARSLGFMVRSFLPRKGSMKTTQANVAATAGLAATISSPNEEVSRESEANRGDKPFRITRPDDQGQAGAEIAAQDGGYRHGQGVAPGHLLLGNEHDHGDPVDARAEHGFRAFIWFTSPTRSAASAL